MVNVREFADLEGSSVSDATNDSIRSIVKMQGAGKGMFSISTYPRWSWNNAEALVAEFASRAKENEDAKD